MKVGDYVRYKYEDCIYIGKIKFISEVMGFEETLQLDIDTCMGEILKEDIIKSSPNIIDILEEHDFVQMEDRGIRFYEIEKDYTGKLSLRDIGWDEYEELDETNIPEIVSIITHEQMEQMKYKVGE